MAAQHVFAAPNNNNVGIHYKPPPQNVLPVDINALVPGQMYHIWSADANNLGQYHGMVGIFQRLFLDYYFFNYEGVLNSQNILVNKDWRPLYAGEGPDPVYLRIRHDRAGEYLIYPINAADIDNGNNAAMNQNGGRRRRARRSRRSRRSRRRRTSKNNRR
jgi:hypothetical protein